MDSEAALSYLMSRTDIDTNKIVIFGRSLGGAVAIALASNELYLDKAFALIVENTFTSIPSMANQLVNGLGKLPYFCFRNKVIILLICCDWSYQVHTVLLLISNINIPVSHACIIK